MTWRLEKIGVYSSQTRELRSIPFRTSGLNIVTGPAARGKSALLDIVDYCLCSHACPVAKGVIREKVSQVAVLLKRGDQRMAVVRALPEPGKMTSSAFWVATGHDVRLPSLAPETRWGLEPAKDAISEFTGIEALPALTNENDSDPEKKRAANIRHCAPFLRQPQDVVASRNVSFPGLDDSFVKRHVVDALDYFLGITSVEILAKRRELRDLQQRLTQLQRHQREQERLKAGGFDRGLHLWSEATALGMIAESTPPKSESELFTGLRRVLNFRLTRFEQIVGELDLSQVVNDEARTRAEIRRKRAELAELDRFSENATTHANITDRQLRKLKVRELLPQSHPEQCPLCGNGTIDVSTIEAGISGAMAQLDSVREPPKRLQTRLARDAEQLRQDLADLSAKHAVQQDQLKSLMERASKQRTLQDEANRRGEIAGRIREYLEALQRTHAPPQEDARALEDRIRLLQREVGEAAVRAQRQQIQQDLGGRISKLASALRVEFSGQPVQLNLEQLTIEVGFDEQWIRLSELGSGANWLGYHVATALGLHSTFLSRRSPVPSMVMFDQPSQAWFPKEGAGAGRLTPVGDEDLEAVKKLYRLLHNEAEADGGPQIIVTDHAVLQEGYFRDSVIENWHDANGLGGLVPTSWLEG
jgi:hypothetical protein